MSSPHDKSNPSQAPPFLWNESNPSDDNNSRRQASSSTGVADTGLSLLQIMDGVPQKSSQAEPSGPARSTLAVVNDVLRLLAEDFDITMDSADGIQQNDIAKQ